MEKKFEKDSMLYKIVEYIFLEAQNAELDIIIDAATKKKQEGDNINMDQATRPLQDIRQPQPGTTYMPPENKDANTNYENDMPPRQPQPNPTKKDAQGSPDNPDVQLNPNEFAKKILSDMKSGKLADKGKKNKIPEFAEDLSQNKQEKYLPPLPDDHIQYLLREFTTKPDPSNSGLLLFCTAAFLESNFGSMNQNLQNMMDQKLPNWPEKFWNFFNPRLQADLNNILSAGKSGKDILQNIKSYCN